MPCDALVFSRSHLGFEFVENFYQVSFFSLFPLERLVDFSALWTYPCSEPKFAERPIEHEANMIAKAAELLEQILVVPVNMRVIKRYLRHHLG